VAFFENDSGQGGVHNFWSDQSGQKPEVFALAKTVFIRKILFIHFLSFAVLV
jgi:hypothetical protein